MFQSYLSPARRLRARFAVAVALLSSIVVGAPAAHAGFGYCCFPSGDCFGAIGSEYCEMNGGVFSLDPCEDIDCPGACCLPNGTCEFLTAADCATGGGEYRGGENCETALCVGGCCLPDTNCESLDLTTCTTASGIFLGLDAACPTSDGCNRTCCFSDGTCQVLSPDDCATMSGTVAASLNCSNLPCPAACCLFDGSCVFVTHSDCEILGDPAPDENCSTVTCRQPCCLPTGLCALLLETQCIGADGRPQGTGSSCEEIDCTEPAHPGWNHVSTEITLTKNEPAYWSALTGQPKGVAPFTVLDPGELPGRPAMDGTNDRVLRGYIAAWAVDANNEEIRWNHLKGDAVIVNFKDPSAHEYNAWAFPVVADVAHGAQSGDPGVLNLDGHEYALAYDQLLLDFYTFGADPFGTNGLVDTNLTLHPLTLDLRQEDDGPVTTKAKIDVWNENETKFNGTERCITCWDCTLLSNYTAIGVPNNFLHAVLQTDKGKARIDGIRSDNCDVDYEFDPDVPFGADPRDIVSVDDALLGVAAKRISFVTPAPGVAFLDEHGHAGSSINLIGSGTQPATMRYDVLDAAPESTLPVPIQQALRQLTRARDGRSTPTEGAPQNTADRVSGTGKGSLLIFSKIEIRWTPQGELYQDTFIDISNDFGDDVTVQMYFINGDAPLD